jgi:hydroxyethylthiazole kinase-like uncharacterized protein yjeF
MRRADQYAIQSGISGFHLMARAGQAVAEVVENLGFGPHRVLAFAGPGNNGGDAFRAAQLLAERGYKVNLCSLKQIEGLTGDARQMAARYHAANLPLIDGLPYDDFSTEESQAWLKTLFKPEGQHSKLTIIDGLLGAGLDRALSSPISDIVDTINNHKGAVVAIDVPTGLNGDTGGGDGTMLQASHTISFFTAKPGHYLLPGKTLCGKLIISDIDIPARALSAIAPQTVLNSPAIWQANASLNPQQPAHKYDNGATLIISGDQTMVGAATMAANAAIRGGAGLVTIALPDPSSPPHNLLSAVMTTKRPSLDSRAVEGEEQTHVSKLLTDKKISAALMGPGCEPNAQTRNLTLALLLENAAIVLDAGALTAFKEEREGLVAALQSRPVAQTVLTPHEGEFKRLFGPFEKEGKLAAARRAAKLTGAVIILKGADTVIAAPSGDAAINNNAPATLATAGTGDVLAGLVLANLARGLPSFKAACRAVWHHGAAATFIGKRLVADDLIHALPEAEPQS